MNRRHRRATKAITGWVPLQRAPAVPLTEKHILDRIEDMVKLSPETPRATFRALIADNLTDEIWMNDIYVVGVRRFFGGANNNLPIVHLSIRRVDRRPARDWRDFQRIKNELIGEDCEAVELYPCERRVVNTANQFHLWGVSDPSFCFPVGDFEGLITSDSGAGSVQRPIDTGTGRPIVPEN